MKLFVLIAASIFYSFAFAQNGNIVIFSEKGLKFNVVIDGVPQHEGLQSNVKITNLPSGTHRIKVRFENEKVGQASRTVFIDAGKEYTFAVRHKSAAGVDATFDGNNREMVKILGNDKNAAANNYDVMENYVLRVTNQTSANNDAGSGQTKVEFIPRSSWSNPAHQLNETEPALVRAGSSSDTKIIEVKDENRNVTEGKAAAQADPAFNRCKGPMDENNFGATRGGIESQQGDDERLDLAKQIISNICMSVEQIQAVTAYFTSEEVKLEFVKFAYEYTFDPENYMNLGAIFSEPAMQDEFNGTFNKD
jgi:hypothetical protein